MVTEDNYSYITLQYHEHLLYIGAKTYIKSVILHYFPKETKTTHLHLFIHSIPNVYIQEKLFQYIKTFINLNLDMERFYMGDSLPFRRKSKALLDLEIDLYNGNRPTKQKVAYTIPMNNNPFTPTREIQR